jgi:putative flippase GtrA
MATITEERPAGPARGRRRSLKLIFTRYTIGSLVAAVATEATLLLTYGPKLLGPEAASVAAWVVGASVNYGLNRWWAWGRRGRARVRRELLPYWGIALTSMALSAWATGVADRLAPGLSPALESGAPRLVFVGGVFLAVYGLMFVVKFVLFHYFVFAAAGDVPRDEALAEDEARRSRHQVPTTTREKRYP